jgi:hypothetical protein
MSAGTFLASLPINPSVSHACCRRVAAHCRNIMLGELLDSSPVLLDHPQKAALGSQFFAHDAAKSPGVELPSIDQS